MGEEPLVVWDYGENENSAREMQAYDPYRNDKQ